MLSKIEKVYLLIVNNVSIIGFVSLIVKIFVENSIYENEPISRKIALQSPNNILDMLVIAICLIIWVATLIIFVLDLLGKKIK